MSYRQTFLLSFFCSSEVFFFFSKIPKDDEETIEIKKSQFHGKDQICKYNIKKIGKKNYWNNFLATNFRFFWLIAANINLKFSQFFRVTCHDHFNIKLKTEDVTTAVFRATKKRRECDIY